MEARRFSFRCHANTIYESTAWLRAEESYQDDILNRPFLACTPAKHLFFFLSFFENRQATCDDRRDKFEIGNFYLVIVVVSSSDQFIWIKMNIRNFIQICIVENIKILDLLLLFFDQLFDYLHRNKDKNCAAERFKDLNVFRTCILWNTITR